MWNRVSIVLSDKTLLALLMEGESVERGFEEMWRWHWDKVDM